MPHWLSSSPYHSKHRRPILRATRSAATSLIRRGTRSASYMTARDRLPPHQPHSRFDFVEREKEVLQFWRDIDAFRESVRQSEGRKPFTFYDGPPFATGKPHYGHLLMVCTVKDVVTRYAHSTGHYVERRFGWDTHGLPVEREIDKKLGITSKHDVMKLGIANYNAECRAIVMRYAGEWRETVERMGRWIDFDNDYKTLNVTFMESVWWVFKQMWEKGLVYRGLRVMPYSTALTTPLSNFEAGLAYKEVTDPAVTVAFPLLDDPETSLLAWTTTPWTLPSNLALCVHPDFEYVQIQDTTDNRKYILLGKLLSTLYKDPKKALKEGKYKQLAKYKGSELKGRRFVPPFDYFKSSYGDRAWVVLNDTYVTADSGTGIVHQAPAFGDDDHRIAVREGIIRKDEIPPCPIDDAGRFTNQVPDFTGQHVKEADKAIRANLRSRGLLVRDENVKHQYPFCWRSDTPLLYKAITAWFVKVEESREQLIENNRRTRWVPASVSENRFGNWLANARDWNISRNRYWGTPLPVWVSDDFEEMICVGSREELARLSGREVLNDLHRESVDAITIPSQRGKGQLRRIEEVFDCWFESGSMPYAQEHYPFENKDKVDRAIPGDFISEAMDQTRGWFYTMLVVSTLLRDTAPWKNLIVCGLVLAEDGRKMSKSLKNYPDPNYVMDAYGSDALRLFLINSPVVRGDNLRFREAGVKEVLTQVLIPWLNAFRFFLTSVATLKHDSDIDYVYDPSSAPSTNFFDRWILARCQSLIHLVRQEMAAYKLYNVVSPLLNLIEELTNWYIKLNRRRLKGESGVEEATHALNSLFETLLTLCRTLSPFTPFFAEHVYQTLRLYISNADALGLGSDLRSLHFLPFPEVRQEYVDEVVERRVRAMQDVVVLVRTIRVTQKLTLKVPLDEVVVYHRDAQYREDIATLRPYIERELNVRTLTSTDEESSCGVQWVAIPDFARLGRRVGKSMPAIKKTLSALPSKAVKEFLASGSVTIEGHDLTTEDAAIVLKQSDAATSREGYATATDGNVAVALATTISEASKQEALAKELLNRIQRGRKAAGLIATDTIDVYLQSDQENSIEELLETWRHHAELFPRMTLHDYSQRANGAASTAFHWSSPEPQDIYEEIIFIMHFVKR